jgi:dynein heavy chain 1
MCLSESENVLAEIQSVSSQYRPFAVACSSIYFTTESLSDVHFLYHFSLPFFLVVVDSLLQKPSQEVKVGRHPPFLAVTQL